MCTVMLCALERKGHPLRHLSRRVGAARLLYDSSREQTNKVGRSTRNDAPDVYSHALCSGKKGPNSAATGETISLEMCLIVIDEQGRTINEK
jgi:hypothetical protein